MKLLEYTDEFYNDNGDVLRSDIRICNDQNNSRPLILILHGFTAFRRWGFFPYIGQRIAEAGAISIIFDFSYNGYGEDGALVFPERFAANTISRERSDIASIISAIRRADFPFWNKEIYLLGHSRGGADAILTASIDIAIKKTAAWGCISTFDRYTSRIKHQWRSDGLISFREQHSNTTIRMNAAYLEDAILPKNNILEAAATMQSELLLIHGQQDLTSPMRNAEKIAAAKQDARLEIIAGTGHTFGIAHPFTATTQALESAIAITIDFFSLQN